MTTTRDVAEQVTGIAAEVVIKKLLGLLTVANAVACMLTDAILGMATENSTSRTVGMTSDIGVDQTVTKESRGLRVVLQISKQPRRFCAFLLKSSSSDGGGIKVDRTESCSLNVVVGVLVV